MIIRNCHACKQPVLGSVIPCQMGRKDFGGRIGIVGSERGILVLGRSRRVVAEHFHYFRLAESAIPGWRT